MRGRAGVVVPWLCSAVCVAGTIAGGALIFASAVPVGTDEFFGVFIPIGLLAFPTMGVSESGGRSTA